MEKFFLVSFLTLISLTFSGCMKADPLAVQRDNSEQEQEEQAAREPADEDEIPNTPISPVLPVPIPDPAPPEEELPIPDPTPEPPISEPSPDPVPPAPAPEPPDTTPPEEEPVDPVPVDPVPPEEEPVDPAPPDESPTPDPTPVPDPDPTPEPPVVAPDPDESVDEEDSVYVRVSQYGLSPRKGFEVILMGQRSVTTEEVTIVNSRGARISRPESVARASSYGNFSNITKAVFSGLSAGEYRVKVGENESPVFSVENDPFERLIELSLDFFSVQRCGSTQAKHHGQCHMLPAKARNLTRDLTGGWHDAGDYSKYLVTGAHVTNLLFTAKTIDETVFADEDRNGRCDILDEALWGAAWVYKMWDGDNSRLWYQVSEFSDRNDWRLPDNDDQDRGAQNGHITPNGLGANLAGKAAASLAFASYFLKKENSSTSNALAERYLRSARELLNHGEQRPRPQNSTADDNYTESTYKDDLALASTAIYLASNDANDLNKAHEWTVSAGGSLSFDHDNTHILALYHLSRADTANSGVYLRTMQTTVEDLMRISSSNVFGQALNGSFRWGSLNSMVGAGVIASLYQSLAETQRYQELVDRQVDFVFGKNPWGYSFVSSIGSRYVRTPFHQIASIKNVPLLGSWSWGPINQSDWRSLEIPVSEVDPLALFQSEDAVFHDDLEDYATNQPTITANATGILLSVLLRQSRIVKIH